MPQLPISHFPINPSTTSGSFLATILNDEQQAIFSSQSGAVAPAVALAGTLWLNTSNATNYILSMYSGSVWVQLFSFDPAVGAPVPGGQSVTSVNARIGAVKIKELYDSTETVILASGTSDGIDMVINIDADPTANLVGTMGRIAYDSTKNQFVGRDNISWKSLGAGSYVEYPVQVIPAGGQISTNNTIGFQFRHISSAADITLAAIPFLPTAPLWAGGQIITIKNSGTFLITINDSRASASGVYLADPIALEPESVISFIFDSVLNRWYTISGSGSGGGAWITYPLQAIAANGTINSVDNKFFQYRRISSGTAIDLSLTPFGSVPWKDGIQINVFNNGANPITFKNGTTTQFGLDFRGLDFILPAGQVASFQYDLTIERWLVIGTSAKTGGAYVITQTVIAGDKVNLLSVPNQAIALTAAGAVILNALPFNIPLDLPNGAEIKLIGKSDGITLSYEATNAVLFGDQTLNTNYILSLIYDKTNNYLIQTGKNY